MKALGNHVLIKALSGATHSAGGIALPDSAKPRHSKGTVFSVGPGHLLPDGSRGAMQVKVGDVVGYLSNPYEVEMDGEKFIVLQEQELLFVVKDEPAVCERSPKPTPPPITKIVP